RFVGGLFISLSDSRRFIMSNFSFLKPEWPQLANPATRAEIYVIKSEVGNVLISHNSLRSPKMKQRK
ncbi:hypothetical protein ACVR06_09785, partial [Streptococcus azizii]